MQNEDQHIDLPDLIDERQAERHDRPDHVHGHQQGPAGDLVDEGVHHWADADIGDHLDGQGAAQHRARIGTCKVER